MDMSERSDHAVAQTPVRVVVMGVSGSGKSSIGEAVGDRLHMPYIDGDTYHSQANIDKMAAGQPLDDDDRAGWLDTLAGVICDHRARDVSLLLGCSALKRIYRDRLREGDPGLIFLFLDGSFDVILQRMNQRQHFFSPDMLKSQFASLEAPDADESIRVDITHDFDTVVNQAVALLAASRQSIRSSHS